MLLPDYIRAQFQHLVVLARGVIVVFACIIIPLTASAQIVEPDVKRWSENQCIWLHQILDYCKSTDRDCSGNMLDRLSATSMSTNRGLGALDAFWTVRDREQFDGICLRVCEENTKPTYRQFKKEFCSKVRKPRF